MDPCHSVSSSPSLSLPVVSFFNLLAKGSAVSILPRRKSGTGLSEFEDLIKSDVDCTGSNATSGF